MDEIPIRKHIMSLPYEIIEMILQYVPMYKFFSYNNLHPIIDKFINTNYRLLPIIYFEELEYLAEHKDKYEEILYYKFYKTLLSFLPYCINENGSNIQCKIKRSADILHKHCINSVESGLYSLHDKNKYNDSEYIFEHIKRFISFVLIFINYVHNTQNNPSHICIELVKNNIILQKWQKL